MIRQYPITIENSGFRKCCAEEIRRLWIKNGGSMNVVRYISNCPKCNHFIGLTQTSVEEANKFLAQYELEPLNQVKKGKMKFGGATTITPIPSYFYLTPIYPKEILYPVPRRLLLTIGWFEKVSFKNWIDWLLKIVDVARYTRRYKVEKRSYSGGTFECFWFLSRAKKYAENCPEEFVDIFDELKQKTICRAKRLSDEIND